MRSRFPNKRRSEKVAAVGQAACRCGRCRVSDSAPLGQFATFGSQKSTTGLWANTVTGVAQIEVSSILGG
jgi:hypothetical protein